MGEFQERFKRHKFFRISFWLLILIALLLNSADFLKLSKSGITADFIAALVFVFTVERGGRQALYLTLICGFLRDYFSAPAMGVGTLALLIVYAIASWEFWPDGKVFLRLLQYSIAHFLAAFSYALTNTLLSWQLDVIKPFTTYLKHYLKLAVENFPLTLLALIFWYFLLKYVFKEKVEESDLGGLREPGSL